MIIPSGAATRADYLQWTGGFDLPAGVMLSEVKIARYNRYKKLLYPIKGLAMEEERRNVKKAVPEDLPDFLSQQQLLAYHGMERFGWYIKFIRRPLFQRPVCILSNPEGTVLATLEEDGNINQQPDLTIRD